MYENRNCNFSIHSRSWLRRLRAEYSSSVHTPAADSRRFASRAIYGCHGAQSLDGIGGTLPSVRRSVCPIRPDCAHRAHVAWPCAREYFGVPHPLDGRGGDGPAVGVLPFGAFSPLFLSEVF